MIKFFGGEKPVRVEGDPRSVKHEMQDLFAKIDSGESNTEDLKQFLSENNANVLATMQQPDFLATFMGRIAQDPKSDLAGALADFLIKNQEAGTLTTTMWHDIVNKHLPSRGVDAPSEPSAKGHLGRLQMELFSSVAGERA